MPKFLRKILPSFLLTALIVIAGGFSDGFVSKASMATMSDQIMQNDGTAGIAQSDGPVKNSLKPCCENKQGEASAIQSSIFAHGAKLMALDSAQLAFENNSVFKNTVTGLSLASPPKSDVLFSVLKKE